MRKFKLSCLAAAMLVIGAPTSLSAGTITSSFQVTAAVVSACSILNSQTIAFGNVVGAAQGTANATISVTCTNGAAYTVDLDGGLGTGQSAGRRSMTATGGVGLIYNIYTDAAYTTIWGTPVVGGVKVSGTGTGSTTCFI